MSFGSSPSDILIVVTFCKALYRKCRDAGGEYDEISREVRALHTVLRHLKYEVEAPDSPLNRDHALWTRRLAPIVEGCDSTLHQLDSLIQTYGRLASPSARSNSTRDSKDKTRLSSNEMDQLGEIRVRLISHKTSLTAFLDSIQLHQSDKPAISLDNHKGQLDVILDKVDAIAARMGQSLGNGAAKSQDDDGEVWKQFRRELVAEGFSNEILQQHKDVLRAYIREIDQKGLLDDDSPDSEALGFPVGVNGKHWLDDVQVPFRGLPPSASPGRAGNDDRGLKEMVNQEDNMKFQQSMRLERPKPDSRQDGLVHTQSDTAGSVPQGDQNRALVQRPPPGAATVVASSDKEVHFLGISDSSSEDSSDFEHSYRARASNAVVIRTVDLLGPFYPSQNGRPASPPSPKTGRASFSDDGSQSLTYRPQNGPEFGSAPSQPETLAPPKSILKSRPQPRLAPDTQGNEISPDAKWTKINRRLVSPEVLAQDKRRYEVRPEFVAVLGVLSRKEIEDYTARTYDLRHFRRKGINNAPAVQPPRREARHSTSEDSESSSLGSDFDRNRRQRRHSHNQQRSIPASGTNYTTHPGPIYPVPYGAQPPPFPIWSPNPASTLHPQSSNSTTWSPSHSPSQSQMYYTPSSKGNEREHRRRQSPRSHKHSHRERDKGRDREREKDRERERERGKGSSRRWKENLTAAGIGAAAVGLIETLAEAAEGIEL